VKIPGLFTQKSGYLLMRSRKPVSGVDLKALVDEGRA